MNRSDHHFSNAELRRALYVSQGLLLLLSVVFILMFPASFLPTKWYVFGWMDLMIGVCFGMVMVVLQAMIEHILPRAWFDDKGIDEQLFHAFPLPVLALIMVAVSLIEETLFRGILQHLLGYAAASLIFAFVHVRYVTKPALLAITLALSFGLGFLFIQTNSLTAPIIAHFTMDTLALVINDVKRGRP
ncbi:CPBP family intramembrane metalloprotease [Sporolactobacillus shoreicorticis]|uniref:CPBP family intramembrane glutamic endopeptidase n=1 Tax=Sporolactobacillus shoreicorticis TaxID=1923877 RepID=A0ABW5RZR6_9BACL|nr:CPBP family intramembrane glutamic endopeptidase [Sporolactobacillus shoreicorticis]MCO7126744.1 CPBP family intramembrane metalloprotease [Sporolactobacillus shoreicorticis]